jgi:hypothetical protein
MAINGTSYSLSWSDFTSVSTRPQGVTEDAQVHPEIRPSNFKIARKGRSVTITDLDIDVGLVSADCWVLSTAKNNDLLKHEQGHFDIIAINAKELYKKLVGLSAASVQALQTSATQLQAKLQRKVTTVDARYDTQTDHSRKKNEQQKWDQQIASEKQKPDGSIDNLPQ